MSRTAFLAAALSYLVLASCSDGGTGPSAASRMESVSGDAQPGFVGIPLDEKLAVRVLDANNSAVPNQLVQWSVTSGGGSITPVQSRSDASGIARTTWTLGLTEGMQEAVANIGGLAPVVFTATASQLGDTCAENPLDLEVGGSVALVGNQSAQLCLASSAGAVRDYVVVAFNTSRASGATIGLSVKGTGVVAPAGAAEPSADPRQASLLGTQEPQRDFSFDARLRDIELRELAPRVSRTGGGALPSTSELVSPSFSLSNPVLGEVITLNANPNQSCTNPLNRPSRVVAISQRAIVMADEGNPPGGFTTGEYQSIAETFDTLVYPLDAANFGEPEDIDNNNRVVLFYTGEVNRLTGPNSSSGFVAGFFFSRDLFPRQGSSRLDACQTSNQAEMLYLMVPDPEGLINGNVREKSFVMRHTTSTMAHELVHLVNASVRLYVNLNSSYPERPWVEEGLAHSAEELLFLHDSGLSTGTNITAQMIQASSQNVTAFNDHQADNVRRLRDYMIFTNQNWAHRPGAPSLAGRGAATYFFRYIVDRLGGDQAATWKALVTNPDTGMRNLESVIHADPVHWMREWAVSLYVDDHVPGLPSRYRGATWNLRSVMEIVFQTNLFALRPLILANGDARTGVLEPGGSLYYRMGVPANGEGTLEVTASTLPSMLSVVVLRTR